MSFIFVFCIVPVDSNSSPNYSNPNHTHDYAAFNHTYSSQEMVGNYLWYRNQGTFVSISLYVTDSDQSLTQTGCD